MPATVDRVAAKQELDRRECEADPATFLVRHVSIEEPDGTVIPLTLWDFQREIIDAIHDDRAVIVLKARRLGASWILLAYALWLAIFQQGVRILILCKTEGDASDLLDRVRRMRDRIAEDPTAWHILAGLQQPKKIRDAVTTLDIGASTLKALVGTPAAARSETAGLVMLDEFAFQRGAADIWRAIFPTIEGGGRLAVVSTGNGSSAAAGLGAEFASQWERAVRGASGIRHLFFPWMVRPGRDEAWKKRTMDSLGDPERFRTEYPEEPADAFVSPDSDLVYDATHLAATAKLGAELDQADVRGPLWLGIDWGTHTHMLLARRLPSGGLYVFREIVDDNLDDIEVMADRLFTTLEELDEHLAFERFDAAGKIEQGTLRSLFRTRYGYNAQWLKIPFGKYKATAIKYVKVLLRRTHAGEDLRRLAISPTGCPELLRQMAILEWRDTDDGKIEKGDDHGADALLTLAAELGEDFYRRNPTG